MMAPKSLLSGLIFFPFGSVRDKRVYLYLKLLVNITWSNGYKS